MDSLRVCNYQYKSRFCNLTKLFIRPNSHSRGPTTASVLKKYLRHFHELHEINFSFSLLSSSSLRSQVGQTFTHTSSSQISLQSRHQLSDSHPVFRLHFHLINRNHCRSSGSNPVLRWIPSHPSHLPSFSLPETLSAPAAAKLPSLLGTSGTLSLVFALCSVLDRGNCGKFPVEWAVPALTKATAMLKMGVRMWIWREHLA